MIKRVNERNKIDGYVEGKKRNGLMNEIKNYFDLNNQ